MKNTFRNSMSTDMRNSVLDKIMTGISIAYDHSKYDKKQILLIHLPVIVFENKDIKSFVEKILKDSNITIRWGKVIYIGSEFCVEATVKVPEHFYALNKRS